MNKRLAIGACVVCTGIVLIGGLISGAKARGQGPVALPGPPSFSSDEDRVIVRKKDKKDKGFVRSQSRKIDHLMRELRDTDDEKKKAELMKQLEPAVAESFDDDMKAREQELSKLEERLNKLRAQLDRRRKAKTEIIQLEVKVLTNEAAGLGFSGGRVSGRHPISLLTRIRPASTDPVGDLEIVK